MPSASQGFALPVPSRNPFPGNQPQQGGPYFNAGAPIAGTSAVQTVTLGGTPTGGSFQLTFSGQTTAAIAWTATDATLAANIAAALNALTNVGPSGVAGAVGTGSSGIGTYTVTFQNQNAELTVPTMLVAANHLLGTSPTVAVAVTTTGVSSTIRGALPGTVVYDYTVPKGWVNVNPNRNTQQFVRNGPNIAVVPLTATSATTGGAVGDWQPPEGVEVLLLRAYILVTTASTGAANLSVGQASSATTSATNLIPATSVHTTGAVIDSFTAQIQAATAAESALSPLLVPMPVGNFVTFTGSASTAGMVATAYIEYLVP
jgi:hypothetical protein